MIGKKNNQLLVPGADQEIPTLGSMDNAGNSVNLISSIICLPSGWDFSVASEADDRFNFDTKSLKSLKSKVMF